MFDHFNGRKPKIIRYFHFTNTPHGNCFCNYIISHVYVVLPNVVNQHALSGSTFQSQSLKKNRNILTKISFKIQYVGASLKDPQKTFISARSSFVPAPILNLN